MSEEATTEDLFLSLYGLTEWEFNQLLVNYEHLNQEPGEQACARLPFKTVDAAEIKVMFELLNGRPRGQALLATILDVCRHNAHVKSIEKAMPLVPKMRASTIGAFYAQHVPLAEQSNVASI
ncbi:hypothetical protein A3I99_00450 [Candidatus Kaiserbacteria bacterium RIFCSPLOWO2_02_FULL_45_11b]|uniref:Uncharacterized protein n=1 Tax=Candidatus Kaiserbacteria bacterium RIFCSPLOWO2_12_FULL_45_26 TaxID=1798525 RepID=A0A1F6FGB1_9BACT|nr:MAG: hypothetical protein A2929_00860 [Candidatus Kaiserbacteria bacterium RIFCSPLOWO2_01_FULL_45_25]OGG84250.1 MAG: hypothetical protein A3I99_00450 [Candidatus Kaiserbacteria bacterium RIFCSPLOWO2_02_FULL_45_11b]OGG84896.1 MAG: hypothetical protein A3G90_02385 [Candidatus Kaiserbacteria bacterium RIFCSPLOWO2_12_FULL_45_26]